MKNISLQSIGLVVLLSILLSLSCGGKVITRPNQTNFQFTINGVVVKDMNLNKDIVYFAVLRDSVAFDSAVVKVGNDTIAYQGNGIYRKEATNLFNFGQSVSITITSTKDNFSLTASRHIPGSFNINDLPLAGDTLNPAGESVPFTWDVSSNASGYFFSVIRPDTTPGVVGYTALDDLNDRSETIPVDAFRTSQGTLVYGRYEVYVIAYNQSFTNYQGMIFELPAGLSVDNLENANGIIGAGVVAQKKRISVVTQ
ncbi:MAG: hypothetical protein ABII96_04840 [Candidatus Zixiibacteriota bacterium]